jgi:HEAT repeat protein
MAITFEQVRSALIPEEPDYQSAAALGVEALPHLRSMVDGGEPMLAAKAAYLASLIDDEGAVEILLAAAANPEPSVRVAAAAATRNLAPSRAEVVQATLSSDDDPGVRAKNAKAAGLDDTTIWEEAVPTDADADAEPEPEPPPTGGLMPGERAGTAQAEGLMPGESQVVAQAVTAEGLMPGERPAES